MRETVRQTEPWAKGCPGSLGCQHSAGVGFLQPRKWLLHSPLAPSVPSTICLTHGSGSLGVPLQESHLAPENRTGFSGSCLSGRNPNVSVFDCSLQLIKCDFPVEREK